MQTYKPLTCVRNGLQSRWLYSVLRRVQLSWFTATGFVKQPSDSSKPTQTTVLHHLVIFKVLHALDAAFIIHTQLEFFRLLVLKIWEKSPLDQVIPPILILACRRNLPWVMSFLSLLAMSAIGVPQRAHAHGIDSITYCEVQSTPRSIHSFRQCIHQFLSWKCVAKRLVARAGYSGNMLQPWCAFACSWWKAVNRQKGKKQDTNENDMIKTCLQIIAETLET